MKFVRLLSEAEAGRLERLHGERMALVIWKEPVLMRQHHIKQVLKFQDKRLRRAVFAAPLTGPVLISWVILVTPKPPGWSFRNDIHFDVCVSLYCAGVILMVTICGLLLTNLFEATYCLDSKGMSIQRAGLREIAPWRHVVHLEVVPHPTLENISLLKFVSRVRNRDIIEEIPFEAGQINIADAFELYKKHGRK